MSKEAIAKKSDEVSKVADKLSNSKAAIVVDSRGLTVAEVTDLRTRLRNEGVKMQVIKNTILTRAVEKAGFENMQDIFVGPSAVAFSDEDAVAPAKVLKKYSDENEQLTIKGGIIEGEIADVSKINTFATLPSREELLAMLANEFLSPIRDVAYVLQAVSDTKSANAAD